MPRRPVIRQQTQVCIGNRTSEMPERAKPMGDVSRTVSTDSGRAYDPHPIIGAAVAVIVVALYGRPTHVIVTTPLLLVMTGLGVTTLSMTARSLAAVAAVLKTVTLAEAQELAKLALSAPSATEARAWVREKLPVLEELGL